MKIKAIKQMLSDVLWGDLDFLVIDSPPGTGDEPLTVAQTVVGARAVIVTTPQELALADVRKSIDFCLRVEMPILGVVENLSGLVCPRCGHAFDPYGRGGGRVTADRFDLDLLGELPMDLRLVQAGDQGARGRQLRSVCTSMTAGASAARAFLKAAAISSGRVTRIPKHPISSAILAKLTFLFGSMM